MLMGRTVVPGWPLWQRLNFFLMTMTGGCLGFYAQHRMEVSHKARLLENEHELARRVERRKALEEELEAARARLWI